MELDEILKDLKNDLNETDQQSIKKLREIVREEVKKELDERNKLTKIRG